MLSKTRNSGTHTEAEAHRGEPVYWMGCEECGAWVSSELIGPDGAGETDEGSFYCTSCRFGEDN
jgi:hypothetical protein